MATPIINAEHRYTAHPDISKFTMHTHETYEIYCFVSGTAKYFIEGTVYRLKQGDILITKKAEAHTLMFGNDMPYERMFIQFNADALLGAYKETALPFLDDRPLGKCNYYPAALSSSRRWTEYFHKICAADDTEEQRLYLTVLISELSEQPPCPEEKEDRKDSMADIIAYINCHLTEDLSLENLCDKFYVSKSHLNRKFKRLTGSTVWEYVTTKRLIAAKELLQNGKRPTTVATQCGFRIYSAFFYAYKAKFGVSPKRDFIPNRP